MDGFGMLISALNIFKKYGAVAFPTGCIHDKLLVYVNPKNVSDEDIKQLEEYHFYIEDVCNDGLAFQSTYFGSA